MTSSELDQAGLLAPLPFLGWRLTDMARCAVLIGAVFLGGGACAQRTTLSQDADAATNGTSLPTSPRAEPSLDTLVWSGTKVLPPLPIPTDEQLRNGRSLLERLAYVLTKMPMTDAVAVLNSLGFSELGSEDYPNYTIVYPKRHDPRIPIGNGFFSVDVQPREKGGTASINGRFSDDVCVSVEDVKKMMGPLGEKISTSLLRDVHPVDRPKPLNSVGYFSIYGMRNLHRQEANGTFAFDYQTCAIDFGFSFVINRN